MNGLVGSMSRFVRSVATTTEQMFKGRLELGDLFQASTELVESTRDATADLISKAASAVLAPVKSNPNSVVFIAGLLPTMTRTASLFIPGRNSEIAWQNAKNNAEIMRLVANTGGILPASGAEVSLPELVERAYEQGTFPALWIVEGLGHYYGDTFYQKNKEPKNLLTDSDLDALPDKSLTMLHAGIGLSFAKENLQNLTPNSPASEIQETVRKIVTLCENSSRPGYTGAAIESLGLVSRSFHDFPMIKLIDEALAAIGRKDLLGYLWHGAGRAVYFSLPDFIPGLTTPWRAVEMCRTEPPHLLGRNNMFAGFAWAVTLVNMPTPLIMETVLKYHGEQLETEYEDGKAFANGVASSVLMRYDTSPNDPNLTPFWNHRPARSNSKLNGLWERLVKTPIERSLANYQLLKKKNCLEELFHYQDLEVLAERLKKSPANQDGTASTASLPPGGNLEEVEAAN